MSDRKDPQQKASEDKTFFGIIIHSFFVIPFFIALAAVLLFGAMHWLTREQLTTSDYLEQVRTGGLTKRWQAAFELSKILANPKLIPRDERFASELEKAFQDSARDDQRVQQYLALAMARTGNPRFLDTLRAGLETTNEDTLYSVIYSLGMLGDKNAVPALSKYLNHTDGRVRSVTVVALGNIADDSIKPALRRMLKDSEPNVQWGAAVSLAKLQDGSGKDILSNLLDRNYLAQFQAVDSNEQTQIVLQAIEASSNLNDQQLNFKLKNLSTNDKNMLVRASALKALDGKIN